MFYYTQLIFTIFFMFQYMKSTKLLNAIFAFVAIVAISACTVSNDSANEEEINSESLDPTSNGTNTTETDETNCEDCEDSEEKTNTLTDLRDNQVYKTVTIGSQVWMAQNLNYKTEDSYCYDDETANCKKYGRLYKWESALEACPDGWHLPTKEELETLFESVGGSRVAGKKLKSSSGWEKDLFEESGDGTDDFGFSALPVGFKSIEGTCYKQGETVHFWSSTEIDSETVYNIYFNRSLESGVVDPIHKLMAISVRCLKD